ncbi:MAG: sulfotransferase [Cytophaga sp.]|nr:sulfotransferase [Undibacterium sp.]
MNMNSETFEIATAVEHGYRHLNAGRLNAAGQQAHEILIKFANEPNAMLLSARVSIEQGYLKEAVFALNKIVIAYPKFAEAYMSRAIAQRSLGVISETIVDLKLAVSLAPTLEEAWGILSELYRQTGRHAEADLAFKTYLQESPEPEAVKAAARAVLMGNYREAEHLCRTHLASHPQDVNAARLLAEIASVHEAFEDAEALLARCIKIAPDYHLARVNYAAVLAKQDKCTEALEQVAVLEQKLPGHTSHQIVKASIFARLAKYQEAVDLYQSLTTRISNQPSLWNSQGHALKTIGRKDDAVKCYQTAMINSPLDGEAYWNLANLKTYQFGEIEITNLKAICARKDLQPKDEAQMCFALGKALEDKGQHAESFGYYHRGNALKKEEYQYDAERTSRQVDKYIEFFSAEQVANLRGKGHQSSAPIFIVGLPRSGSTLLEQIVASHSLVDGTKELTHILATVRQLSGRDAFAESATYPTILATMSNENLIALGQHYLDRAEQFRGAGSFFIDKMPNNFFHIGLIKSILPNAKFIDARRDPMSACFSCFKQLFANGQTFSYSINDLGQYYRDYLRLMDHWQAVYPGDVLTVNYADVVDGLEGQVLRILSYCNLPLETQCIEFHQNKRAVATPSSEQVRQPIYRSGLDAWRPYESFLKELIDTLHII